jgi:hypothetical protein
MKYFTNISKENRQESVVVDISKCLKYINSVVNKPSELILIKHFKMSFQLGDNIGEFDNTLYKLLTNNIPNKKESLFTKLRNLINYRTYYKTIHIINSIIEREVLKKVNDISFIGVEFKDFIKLDKENILVEYKLIYKD